MTSGILHAPLLIKTVDLLAAKGVPVLVEKPLCGVKGYTLLASKRERVTCRRCLAMLKLRGKL